MEEAQLGRDRVDRVEVVVAVTVAGFEASRADRRDELLRPADADASGLTTGRTSFPFAAVLEDAACPFTPLGRAGSRILRDMDGVVDVCGFVGGVETDASCDGKVLSGVTLAERASEGSFGDVGSFLT
jgi:hypothetical protein